MVEQQIHHKHSLISKIGSHRARFFIAVVLILLLFMVVEAVSAGAAVPQMQRTPLLEKAIDLPSKNVNAKVTRVSFPVAFKTPWHTHEGPGPRYVVKGTLKVSEGDKVNTYSAGEVFWESGSKMMVENIGQEPAELVIFELAPNH